ncbi:MAG: Gfo/Idh/MocA family oxidoreductase [Gammaproteobacteria bacterium]|nr:Gfo/Idh/MocA family oxidoreductase [Gammaproteobacteria bacterium]
MELEYQQNITSRPLRAGIVGGGSGAFIGAVHRMAAQLDGQAQIVAGALSSREQVAHESAQAWFLPRSYSDFTVMAKEEAAREDGIDFVIIATPNHMHATVALAFIEAGIHVMCEKPMALSVSEAEEIARALQHSQVLFALAHTYTGYPAVHEARAMIQQGLLGDIRKVLVEYNQDWLMAALESGKDANKQASWRTDPARAGISCCVGDIGTHAANMVEFMTGDRISAICADLSTFVQGRQLDDDANMLIRLAGGGKGTLVCSQIACGEENALSIRVYGAEGAIEWHQQEPNTLWYAKPGQPRKCLRTAVNLQSPQAQYLTRTPGGHPEGILESLAGLYRLFIDDIRRFHQQQPLVGGYPGLDDGIRGMHFIQAAVNSAQQGAVWQQLPASS